MSVHAWSYLVLQYRGFQRVIKVAGVVYHHPTDNSVKGANKAIIANSSCPREGDILVEETVTRTTVDAATSVPSLTLARTRLSRFQTEAPPR